MNSMQYDVAVVGAGSAGMCAALAAAREGKRVLLVEKNGILGGTNTASMVGPLMTFHAGDTQVVKGIAQEIVDRLAQRGGTLGHVPDPIGVTATITPVEPTILKQVYFEMVRETPEITLLLHTFVDGVQTKNNVIQSISLVNKSGRQSVSAAVFIDATGDGDLAAYAKAKFVQGRPTDGFSQPMSALFKLGGVDFSRVRAYIAEHPEQFVLRADAEKQPYVAVSGYFDVVARARKAGELNVARDRVLLFQGVRQDEAIVNMSRITKLRGINTEELTKAELESRAQIDEIVAFFKKYIDGFQSCRLIETGDSIGVRESRHIEGRYKLTEADVVSGAKFADTVAVCAFPIDIHDPLGQELHWTKTDESFCYDVPYRVMLPQKIENLLVTGRCVSATHEAAASVRVTPTAMALGEAAGIAAAMAASEDCPVDQIDVALLQEKLIACGCIRDRDSCKTRYIHFPKGGIRIDTFSEIRKKIFNLKAIRRSLPLYLLMIPGLCWILCFRLMPLPGILIAFKDYNIFDGFSASPWVGLKYFERMFSQKTFLNVIINTFSISLLKLVVLFPIPIVLALMLNEFRSERYKKLSQTVIYLPHFLSYVVIHGIFTNLLSTQGGAVNQIIAAFGRDPINFYTNDYFRFVLLLTEGFKDAGWNTIIYLSALAAIDAQVIEAAEVDGANKFQQMIHITLPSLLPVIMLTLTLRVGNIMQAGTDQILVMYNPSVYKTADVIGTYVYREGVGSGKFSMATAVGLFESVVAFVMVLGTNLFTTKVFDRGLWK